METQGPQVNAQVEIGAMVVAGDQLMMSYEMLPANTVLCSSGNKFLSAVTVRRMWVLRHQYGRHCVYSGVCWGRPSFFFIILLNIRSTNVDGTMRDMVNIKMIHS